MAITIASANTVSLTTGLKTSDQVGGRNQYIGKGRIQLIAKASAAAATGIRCTLNVGGVALMDDQYVPYAGTTGGLSVRDNMVIDQVVAGGRVELFFRNDSAGTLTVDYMLLFTPM
jgi:hypothetical protein